MGGSRAPTYWGGILQIWTKYIYNAVRHAYLFLSNRLNPFCCILNLSTRWLERMQRPPWIIVGRRGRWLRPTRTFSSPSSTGWRRRRPSARSTWSGAAGQRSRPPRCRGCAACSRSFPFFRFFFEKKFAGRRSVPCLDHDRVSASFPARWCLHFCLVHLISIWKEFWTMIFFRAGLGWCKATILATTGDPGHLPSRPLIWKRMTSSPWASCVKLCPGDQADVDLSRRPVRGLAEPERGAQLPTPPLRTCYEALGRQPLSTQGCFDEGEASWQDHSNLKKT